MIPKFYALSLNSTTTALYLDNTVEKGQVYHYELTMICESLISEGNITAP